MQQRATLNLIFNGLGILLGLFLVGYIVSEAFQTDEEATCRSRYPAPMRFALRTGADDGTLLSPIELQGRAGADEWGIASNAKVVGEGPNGAALEVKLAAVPDREATRTQRANGISFRWNPPGVQTAKAACLSYSVLLPDDFDFASGGRLPGFIGGKSTGDGADGGQAQTFGTRPEWRHGGAGEFLVATPGSGYSGVAQTKFSLARGRWVEIEQEIVLNSPKTTDGIARLWVDGRLAAEDLHLDLRQAPEATLEGVLADIGYLRQPAKPGTLRISAFDFAWR